VLFVRPELQFSTITRSTQSLFLHPNKHKQLNHQLTHTHTLLPALPHFPCLPIKIDPHNLAPDSDSIDHHSSLPQNNQQVNKKRKKEKQKSRENWSGLHQFDLLILIVLFISQIHLLIISLINFITLNTPAKRIINKLWNH
jgi:hypothetical protein